MDAVEQVALALRVTRDATIATYAVLLYEFLIMIDREYESIYKSRWSASKCLYLACRFVLLLGLPIVIYAFFFDHDMESCQPILVTVSVVFTLCPCFPQCVYVLRAYAITGAKRWSLLIYLPCLFGHLFTICWYSVKEMALRKEVFLILGKTGCFPVTYNEFPRMLFAVAGLDGVIGLMLVVHFIRLRGPQTPLGKLLITQSIFYFLVMLFLYVGAAVITLTGISLTSKTLVLSAIFIIPNIMACRLYASLHKLATNIPKTNFESFFTLA